MKEEERTKHLEKAKKYEDVTQKYGDPWIWGIYFSIIIISILETYSASSREVAKMGVYMPLLKHCFFLAVGFVTLLFLAKIPYNKKSYMAIYTVGLFLFTLATLVYVLLFGEVINGAQRAIRFAGITLQPSEFAKLSTVTALAYILARTQKKRDVSGGGIITCLGVIFILGGLIYRSGLTNFALVCGISVVMMITGGINHKKIIGAFAFMVVLGGIFGYLKLSNAKQEENLRQGVEARIVDEGDSTGVTIASTDQEKSMGFGRSNEVDRSAMRSSRFKDWWNNGNLVYRPVTDKNSQEMFSHMAQAHGGFTGVFFGNSRESARLPLAFSDYIYSIIVEDTGFVGGTIVLMLYIAILLRAAMIARRCRRLLPALLVIGMASMITLQALCHMAINTGVFPVSGQPLPLISKGGTSIIIMNVAFAFLLSISRTVASYSDTKNIKKEEEELPENLRAENISQIDFSNEWK